MRVKIWIGLLDTINTGSLKAVAMSKVLYTRAIRLYCLDDVACLFDSRIFRPCRVVTANFQIYKFS